LGEETCSAVSRALGEPLLATASRVRAWVLIEQPGPWGGEALLESRLDPAVGRALHQRAHAAGVRAVLIRRPGRTPPGRHVFLAHTDRQAHWLEEVRVGDPGELLALDWTRLVQSSPPGYGAPVAGTIYLACTNGRHDQCCATWGRPLAQELAGLVGGRLWECSHIGGDRFAGNLVCLPEGVYYGRLGPAEASRVVALDDLVAEWREAGSGGVAAVRFDAGAAGRWLVRLQVTPGTTERLLTCHATRPYRPPVYRLLDLARLEQSDR
jgi:hypothetical protein